MTPVDCHCTEEGYICGWHDETWRTLRAELAALREELAGWKDDSAAGMWMRRAETAERDLAQARELLARCADALGAPVYVGPGLEADVDAFLNPRRAEARRLRDELDANYARTLSRDEAPPYVCPHDRRTWVDGQCPRGCTRDEARREKVTQLIDETLTTHAKTMERLARDEARRCTCGVGTWSVDTRHLQDCPANPARDEARGAPVRHHHFAHVDEWCGQADCPVPRAAPTEPADE